jgi:hypothetical protein
MSHPVKSTHDIAEMSPMFIAVPAVLWAVAMVAVVLTAMLVSEAPPMSSQAIEVPEPHSTAFGA